MPRLPARPCLVPGCPNNAISGGRCPDHVRTGRLAYEERRPSARQRGYDSAWERTRRAFLAENPECEICGEPATDVDHRLARRLGGTDEWSNLQALCHRHHSQKTAREDGGFGRASASKSFR